MLLYHNCRLQAHIDELTGEKLELLRGLAQASKATCETPFPHPHPHHNCHPLPPHRCRLQAHIDELTGEKLELLRGLAQASKANEALAEENRMLGEQLNKASGRAGAEEAVMRRMQVCRKCVCVWGGGWGGVCGGG